MIRHCVVFRFAEGVDGPAVDALADALRALPAQIPEILAYTVGADLHLRDTNADFAVVADFAHEDDFLTYSGHPAHQAVIRDHVEAIVVDRHAVQLRC